jgi:hypothetical protein
MSSQIWKIALLTAILVPTVSIAFQNEPTSFRGIAWGTPLSAVQGQMKFDHREGHQDMYTRSGDSMTLGDASLRRMLYVFYQGVFSEVYLASDRGSGGAMIGAFRSNFGPGYQENPHIDRYLWDGSMAFICLTCNAASLDCEGVIESKAIHNQKIEDDAAAASRAKKDF